jgi:hypothetical protein
MNLGSKFFDRIRIKPRHAEETRAKAPRCAWEGCNEPGIYRAPKGHRSEGEFHNFCLEHVRHYNTAFNFFSGMSAEEVEARVSQNAQTDGRPSWGFGAKADYKGPKMPNRGPKASTNARFTDPLNIFAHYNYNQRKNPQPERHKPMHEPDRRALETLGIEGRRPLPDEIKKAYKTLVKIHHPDANGGDKSSEDRLRSIIAAYTHLKSKGFVTS